MTTQKSQAILTKLFSLQNQQQYLLQQKYKFLKQQITYQQIFQFSQQTQNNSQQKSTISKHERLQKLREQLKQEDQLKQQNMNQEQQKQKYEQIQQQPLLMKDFRFFIMKAKVQQVYRESLKEAQSIQDLDLRKDMSEMMKDEFDVFRRQKNQKLDSDKIDYYLAIIRKKLTIIEEIKKRTQI